MLEDIAEILAAEGELIHLAIASALALLYAKWRSIVILPAVMFASLISLLLGIRAHEMYGLTEMRGPGVAFSCEYFQLHINEDCFYPEVIDPVTEEPLEEGEEGELVLTPLGRSALPLLRYRTGDLTALDRSPCRCGRTLVRMRRVRGRIEEMIVLGRERFFPVDVEEVLLGFPELTPHYLIRLLEEEAVRVEVEVREGTLKGKREGIKEEIREEIISVVSKNGGHLAPSLGVVELTLALHYVFDTPKDKIIWDVGHQAYAHKIITGRRSSFRTLRQWGGISGFPRRSESPYDVFDSGHSGSALPVALGMAEAGHLRGDCLLYTSPSPRDRG